MGVNHSMNNRAVFLDRDGVINHAFVRSGKPFPPNNFNDFKIIDGVAEALHNLRINNFKLIIVTNQPDVARGTIKIDFINQIHAYLLKILPIDDIRVCPHSDIDKCFCRKPNPGMIIDSAKKYNVDLTNSFMVGDRWRDIDAGHAAGCKAILIDYKYNEQLPKKNPNFVCSSLIEAADWIILHSGV